MLGLLQEADPLVHHSCFAENPLVYLFAEKRQSDLTLLNGI